VLFLLSIRGRALARYGPLDEDSVIVSVVGEAGRYTAGTSKDVASGMGSV